MATSFFLTIAADPGFASGGFIADSQFTSGTIINGEQQQWITRNSNIDRWTNGVWNQVFSGVVGAPAQCFPQVAPCSGPYTTLAASPVTREEPYLYVDSDGNYNVFVAGGAAQLRRARHGPPAQRPARPSRIETFFIAQPTDTADTINMALGSGKNLILTPGIYNLDRAIEVTRPDTVVLGLGFPTLIPQNGIVSMSVRQLPRGS